MSVVVLCVGSVVLLCLRGSLKLFAVVLVCVLVFAVWSYGALSVVLLRMHAICMCYLRVVLSSARCDILYVCCLSVCCYCFCVYYGLWLRLCVYAAIDFCMVLLCVCVAVFCVIYNLLYVSVRL